MCVWIMFMENWNSYNNPRISRDNPKMTAGVPTANYSGNHWEAFIRWNDCRFLAFSSQMSGSMWSINIYWVPVVFESRCFAWSQNEYHVIAEDKLIIWAENGGGTYKLVLAAETFSDTQAAMACHHMAFLNGFRVTMILKWHFKLWPWSVSVP